MPRYREPGRTWCAVGLRCVIKTADKPRNSNVSKILPLTTFRTIDLGGRKNSGHLFSIFCGKTRVFLEVNPAPECVHRKSGTGCARRPRSHIPAARIRVVRILCGVHAAIGFRKEVFGVAAISRVESLTDAHRT